MSTPLLPTDDPAALHDYHASLVKTLQELHAAAASDPDPHSLADNPEYHRLYDEMLFLELEGRDLTRLAGATLSVCPLPHGEALPHDPPLTAPLLVSQAERVVDWIDRLAPQAELHALVHPAGVPVELIYSAGKLERAVARGNGRAGPDLTAHARYIRAIPKRLTRPDAAFHVEGVISVTHDDIARINRILWLRGCAPLAAARASVSTLLRCAGVGPMELRTLGFTPTRSRTLEATGATVQNTLDVLHTLGFAQAEAQLIPVRLVDELLVWHRTVSETALYAGITRLDGMLIRPNHQEDWARLNTAAAVPNHARLFLFPDPRGVSAVHAIDHSTSRYGALVPHAHLHPPLILGGRTVESATLFSATRAVNAQVGRGAVVEVSLVGGRTPTFQRVLDSTYTRLYYPPTECPHCASETVMNGQHMRCPNPQCPGTSLARLSYATSPSALDVPELTHVRLATLRQEYRVTLMGIGDLFLIPHDPLALMLAGPGGCKRSAEDVQARLRAVLDGLADGSCEEDGYVRLLTALSLPEIDSARAVDIVHYAAGRVLTEGWSCLAYILESVEELVRCELKPDAARRVVRGVQRRRPELDAFHALLLTRKRELTPAL